MDKFSFPVMIPAHDDDQFEFGCVTMPGSPNTPADHLFANGKLLPHVFPIQTGPTSNYYSFSRSASRTSSKDYSLVSSRSNSSNSTRTSTSESGSSFSGRGISSNRLPAGKERNVLGPQAGGSSKRWQLIAAAPVLKKQPAGSRSTVEVNDRKMSRKSRPIEEDGGGDKTSWFGKRILKSFVSTCKQCHAITT